MIVINNTYILSYGHYPKFKNENEPTVKLIEYLYNKFLEKYFTDSNEVQTKLALHGMMLSLNFNVPKENSVVIDIPSEAIRQGANINAVIKFNNSENYFPLLGLAILVEDLNTAGLLINAGASWNSFMRYNNSECSLNDFPFFRFLEEEFLKNLEKLGWRCYNSTEHNIYRKKIKKIRREEKISNFFTCILGIFIYVPIIVFALFGICALCFAAYMVFCILRAFL